jgi:hypothetical protein
MRCSKSRWPLTKRVIRAILGTPGRCRFFPDSGRIADIVIGRNVPILLQKSKVAGLRIFAKNPKREAIADSYNLNRTTEVAYEFNVRR